MAEARHMLVRGDARRIALRDESVHCVVTSPPYWSLRDYGTGRWEGGDPTCDHRESKPSRTANAIASSGLKGGKHVCHMSNIYRGVCGRCGALRIDRQIGLEESPDAYVATMVAVFREVWRVLRDDGTVWLNLGDSYSSGNRDGHGKIASTKQQTNNHAALVGRPAMADGLKPKDLCLIPERVALALQSDGWYIRAKPPWVKANGMPESVSDRPTVAHESIFLLSKRADYFYDADAIREEPQSRPQRRFSINRNLAPDRGNGDSGFREGCLREHVAHDCPDAGRNRRTSDWFNESLDELIAHHEAYAAHLRGVRENGGMLADEDGDPLAFCVTTNGFPGAHFATFPPRLVKPMVCVSTSEKGCCPACGKPWERVVEREPGFQTRHVDVGDPSNPRGRRSGKALDADYRGIGITRSKDLGSQPGCACGAGSPVPAIIFDPFAGAATTLVVANALGRHAIGCDLSREYLDMSRRRIERPHAPVERAAAGEALPLFDAMEGLRA